MRAATAILQATLHPCHGCRAATAQTTPDGRLFQCADCTAAVPTALAAAPHDSTEPMRTPKGKPCRG